MTAAGKRDRLVVFQRASAVTTDDYGGDDPERVDYVSAWALVTFGTGIERREAAQNSGSTPATFRVLRNTKTADLKTTDRIRFMDADWDIASVVPFGRKDMDITATRRAN